MNNKRIAEEILKDIGGESNIEQLEHCSTRLRFSLKDDKKVNKEKLIEIPDVLGVKINAQCQVIIGNGVIEVYDELIKMISKKSTSKLITLKNFGPYATDFMISIFQPILPAIAGAGILKSILLVLAILGWANPDNVTYQVFDLIGTAPIYFLPLLVAITTARKLNIDIFLALAAVGVLLLPDMTEIITSGNKLFVFDIPNISYASQIFPSILTVIFLAQVEKFCKKISPKAIRIFFVPLITLAITVPVALLILGPLGYNLGVILSSLILFLSSKLGWLAVGLLACALPFMVATGMHKVIVPYALDSVSRFGFESLFEPAALAHNISESGVCFAIALKAKDKDKRALALSAGISALCGITEPALYGITLLNKKILYIVSFTAFIGGSIAGFFALKTFAIVSAGLPSISMFADKNNPMNLIWALVVLVVSFVISFSLAFVFYKEEEDNKEGEISENKVNSNPVFDLDSPIKGKLVALDDVDENVFSSGFVGKGVGIIPKGNIVYAPFEGKVTMVSDENDTIGLSLPDGAEVLLHLNCKANRFRKFVNKGDEVFLGDELLAFENLNEGILNESAFVVCIVTNPENYIIDLKMDKEFIDLEDTIMTVQEKE